MGTLPPPWGWHWGPLPRSCPGGHLGRRGKGIMGLSMPIITLTQHVGPSPSRAKACEELLRYAVYNCMSIDTDKNAWDE